MPSLARVCGHRRGAKARRERAAVRGGESSGACSLAPRSVGKVSASCRQWATPYRRQEGKQGKFTGTSSVQPLPLFSLPPNLSSLPLISLIRRRHRRTALPEPHRCATAGPRRPRRRRAFPPLPATPTRAASPPPRPAEPRRRRFPASATATADELADVLLLLLARHRLDRGAAGRGERAERAGSGGWSGDVEVENALRHRGEEDQERCNPAAPRDFDI